jgi:hypothetical protein
MIDMDRAVGVPLPTWRIYCEICDERVATYGVYADVLDCAALEETAIGDPLYFCDDCRLLYVVLHTPPRLNEIPA